MERGIIKPRYLFAFVFLVILGMFQNCSESQLVFPDRAESVVQKAGCEGPQGEAVADGETIAGYFTAAEVGCSEVCEEQALTCQNGQIVGAGGDVLTNSLSATAQTCRAVCDNRNVAGNEVTGMRAGKPYLVSIYGVTANNGTGNATLKAVRLESCAGQALATSQEATINWHDGSAPQSHTFSVNAPADGCVRGFVDDNALNVTVSEQKETGANSATNQATGLTANSKYLVNVYGITRNRGQDNLTLDSVGVDTCNGTGIAATDAPTVNWPDGNVPHSMSFVAQAPADGCLEGHTDGGAANALNMSVQKAFGDARTVAGSQVTGLSPGKNYFVSVYGLTSQVVNEAATDILDGVKVTTCNGEVLATTQSLQINWHDGSAPQNASLVIEAPADGCVQAGTDGGPAHMVTVVEVN